MVLPQRKGTDRIDDPKKRAAVFSKRSDGLMKKASALNSLIGASVALISFSPEGKLRAFGTPSVEEVFSEYLRQKGDVKLPVSPKEGADWAEKGRDSCAAKEDSASLKMVPSLRKGTDRIDDLKERAVTFSKRSDGLVKKVSDLNSLTGACVAVIIISPEGELCFFGAPSVEEVFSEFLRHKGGVELPVNPEEGPGWAENNPSVNAGAGDDSGVGAGRDPKVQKDDEIDFASTV